jgi:hypothetical protein
VHLSRNILRVLLSKVFDSLHGRIDLDEGQTAYIFSMCRRGGAQSQYIVSVGFSGVVRGSALGLEIDVSNCGSVHDTFGCSRECLLRL